MLALLLSRDIWQAPLVDALEGGQVLPSQIDARSRQRLLAGPSEPARLRAEKLFAGAMGTDRQQVLDAYRPALSLPADRERGKVVFGRVCANCHRLGELGTRSVPTWLRRRAASRRNSCCPRSSIRTRTPTRGTPNTSP